jgi:hypothetical protein
MKRLGVIAALWLLAAGAGFATPLATAARSVIPKDVQQIICVDYRTLKASSTALALKDRVLPPNIKEFETAVRGVGLDPDKDVESLTFASFRSDKNVIRMIGIAQGQFPTKQILRRFKVKKIVPVKYHLSWLYPAASGMQMSFLDDFTMLFGDDASIKEALDARDGYSQALGYNSQMTDLVNSVDDGPVWSVLDQQGTQNMMHSTLGDAAQLADYDAVKKHILGSRYTMDFSSGVKFDLDVVTSDAMTATTLSTVVKAGMMYRRMTAAGSEKTALENVTVDSQSADLRLHFKASDNQFQSLLQSDLFAALSR